MLNRHVLLLLLLSVTPVLLLSASSFAQRPAPYASIVEDMREREFATIRADFLAAAELMPAEHYPFKPVDTVRSFGDEVAHATAVNRRLCSMASGASNASTPNPPAPSGKDALLAALKASFEQCAGVLGTATDESVRTRTVGPYIRASHLTAMLGHNNEVYGKLALMLRMKELVPPSTTHQTKGQ